MIKAVVFDWYGTLFEKNRGPFPDSLSTLQELERRNIKLGLVSKTRFPDKVQFELNGSGLWSFFNQNNKFLTLEKNQNQFLYFAGIYNLSPRDMAVIGDRAAENREIHIGNQVGCQTYWIQRGEYSQELPNATVGQPTQIITSVREILKYID